jgi:iron complex outermembrane receptor protein
MQDNTDRAHLGRASGRRTVRRAAISGASLLTLLAVVAIADQASAQTSADAKGTSPEEVIVTARGRAETLIASPISVQSFSGAQLAAANITDLADLQYSAGFTFNSQGASFLGGGREFPTLVFRGMTSNYGGGFADSGALFVDGIYISGGAASVTMADVSQVEVLKGPQNVYFGKNTFGGAVNLITSNPSEDFHYRASAGYSDKGSYDDTASVEGALIPGLLTGRITGELYHQGKQYTAADGGALGEQDTKGITAVLYATPTPGIWVRTRLHYSHDDDSEAADGFVGGVPYGTTCPGMVNAYFCSGNIPSLGSLNAKTILSGTTIPQALLSDLGNNNFYGSPGALLTKVPTEDHAGLVRDNLQASLQSGVKLPYDATFQFSAGYNQADSLDITSSDHTPANAFTSAQPVISRDFEADARILTSSSQPLRVTAGVNYFRSVYQLVYDGFFFAAFANSNPVNEWEESEAAYGSAEYDLTSYLTLSGDVRIQKDTITDGELEGLDGLTTPVSKSYYHTLPRLIVKYHPTKNTNLYLSYSEGVQPPQLQTSYITADSFEKAALSALGAAGDYTQDPKVRVWEIGLKQSLFDDRLFFSVDYYNQFWDNALVETFVFNDPANHCSTVPVVGVSAACPYPGSGAGIFGTSSNHIQGIEFDGTARITTKWNVHGAFNWTDGIRTNYYDDSWGSAFTSGSVPLQNGKRIDLVPEFQWTLDSTYKDHLTGDYNWYVHGIVNYTGQQYVEATDIAKISGYYRVNLFGGITKGNLTFEAFVTNLFDDKNWDYAVRFPNPNPPNYFGEASQGVIGGAPNPRDVGFKISAKY